MKKSIFIACVSILLMLIPSSLYSQGVIYLGVLGGLSVQKPSLEEVEFNTDTTYLYGIRAGVKFMMLALEINYFQVAHNLKLSQLTSLDWGGREIDYNFLGVNLKYFIPLFFLHPYLTVGYGYYKADIYEIDKDTDRGYNLGLGLEVHLGDKLSLVGEGKYHHVKVDIEERGLKLGDFTVTGGFNFYF